MRDTHLRSDGASLRHDLAHVDRPAFGIAPVELHEIGGAAEADQILWPFEDKVICEQFAHANPVARLNPAPELGNNLAWFHDLDYAPSRDAVRRHS